MATDSDLGFVQAAFELMDEMGRIETADAVRDRLLTLLRPCGFDYFTITRLPHPRERLGPSMLLKVWPDAWLSYYDRKGYYRNDPVGRHCFTTIDPFLWSEVPLDRKAEPHAVQVMGEAGENGLREGLCIPLHDINGFQAVISMAGDRVELSPSRRRAVHLLGLYAFGAADRLDRARRRPSAASLSAREREVLCWLAVGKTAGEVADILDLSRTTVETHLGRAKLKLGTTNTTHTVVEALRQHQIQI